MRLFEFAPSGRGGNGNHPDAYAYFWLEYETERFGTDEGMGIVPIVNVSDSQLAYLQQMIEQHPDEASELSDEMLFNCIVFGGTGNFTQNPARSQMVEISRNRDVNHNQEEFDGHPVDLQWVVRMAPIFAPVLQA